MFLRGIFCALTLRKTKLQVAGLLKVGMLKASQITAIKLLSKYDKSSRSDYSFDFWSRTVWYLHVFAVDEMHEKLCERRSFVLICSQKLLYLECFVNMTVQKCGEESRNLRCFLHFWLVYIIGAFSAPLQLFENLLNCF